MSVEETADPASDTDWPLVTLIMPVRNERAFLGRALECVLGQDYPADRLEILVADGMSTDGTRELLAQAAAEHPNLRWIDNPGRIVPTGMNLATAHARGTVIVRVDGHCEIAPDYLRHCVEHLRTAGIDGVGGPIETIGQDPVSEVIARAMSSRFGVGGSAFRTGNCDARLVDTIPFPAYRRAAIDRAGPYDEEMVRNQDDEYNYRLRKLGARLMLAADVRSRYYSRSSLRSLWRQYFQYGYWKVRVLQKHPRQMRVRQFAPAALVAGLIVLVLMAIVFPWARWALAGLAAAYAVVNLGVSLLMASRERLSAGRLLPLVFAILHFSYGLGFWKGLWVFRRRWFEGRSS